MIKLIVRSGAPFYFDRWFGQQKMALETSSCAGAQMKVDSAIWSEFERVFVSYRADARRGLSEKKS